MREDFIVTVAVVALATAVSHALSDRLRLPIVIFLLGAGILFGPEVLDWVEPESLGDLLQPAIALAVAIIVFEGAFTLDGRSLRLVSPGVRNLVMLGLPITIAAGALISHYLLGFEWRLALEFGALISVTGPTVIRPLLQRVKVNDRVHATLLGEAVIVDPLGAMAAVVALEILLEAGRVTPTGPALWITQRLALGLVLGVVAGFVAGWTLRRLGRRLASDEIWLAVLALALGVFAISEVMLEESGLVAVVGFGLVLGNVHIPHERDVQRYEDAVSLLVIGGIFVVLTARLEFDDLRALGWEGIVAVVLLVFAVRPAMVLLVTQRTGLLWHERGYIGTIGPRGVVAASFATFAAVELEQRGLEGGPELVGLVFLTILVSVVVQSAWAGPFAHVFKVRPMGVVIAGAGRVGQMLARRLTDDRESVVLIDANEQAATAAREAGLNVVLGDIKRAATLEQADIASAKAFVATTENDQDNLLSCQLALTKYKVKEVVSVITDPENRSAFQNLGIRTLNPVMATASALDNLLRRPNLSDLMLGGDRRVLEETVQPGPALGRRIDELRLPGDALVILVRRGPQVIIPHGSTRLARNDVVTLVGEREDVEFARCVMAGEVDTTQAQAVVTP